MARGTIFPPTVPTAHSPQPTQAQLQRHIAASLVVSTFMPDWVLRLLPQWDGNRTAVLTAAAIHGIQDPRPIRWGQASTYQPSTARTATLRFTPQEVQALRQFGVRAGMSTTASVLRTAIMVGLDLPDIHAGVAYPTREKPLTKTEWLALTNLHNVMVHPTRVQSECKLQAAYPRKERLSTHTSIGREYKAKVGSRSLGERPNSRANRPARPLHVKVRQVAD